MVNVACTPVSLWNLIPTSGSNAHRAVSTVADRVKTSVKNQCAAPLCVEFVFVQLSKAHRRASFIGQIGFCDFTPHFTEIFGHVRVRKYSTDVNSDCLYSHADLWAVDA